MKAKRLLHLIFFILIGIRGAQAQAPPVFDAQRCMGGTGTDIPSKIISSLDGGYIFAGSTSSSNGDITLNRGANDFWIIKTNISGVMEWQKTFGGSSNDIATAVLELNNHDVVVSGYTYSNNQNVSGNHGSSDFWLIRLSSSGNLIWKKAFGGTSAEYCYSMTQSADGGIVLAGSSSSNNGNVSGNHGGTDFWILKTDNSGNLLWQQSFGGSGAEECYSIKSTIDSGFIASGYTTSNNGQVSGNHGGYDFWVIKLDATGNLQWQKCLGGTSNDVSMGVLQNNAGDFLAGGYTNSTDGDITINHGGSDYWIAWLNSSDGNLLSQKSFGGSNSDLLFDLIVTTDNGFLFAGASTSNNQGVTGNHGGEDFWLIKTDSSGDIRWSKSYGGSLNDRPVSVLENEDGGFSSIGYTYSNNEDVEGAHGGADFWFLKLSCFAPVSYFEFSSDTVCINSSVDFLNTSSHAALTEWKIDNISFSNAINANLMFNETGTYKITLYSYTCHTTDSLSKYVTVVNYPVPSISSNASYLCLGNEATLSTIDADRYAWSNGSTTREIIVNAGGNYSVTVTTNGCSSTTAYSLDQHQPPAVELGNDLSICSGNEITISAPSGFASYVWQDGSTANTLTVSSEGVFRVIVSDDFCSSSDSLMVHVINNPIPSILASNSHLCGANPETLSATVADSYLWSTGETTPSIEVNSAGNYSVTVTANGCSGSASFAMSQFALPSVNIGNDTSICSGTSIRLRAPSGYQSYLWQNNSTGNSFSASSAGVYHVTVNDGNCSATDSIQISTYICTTPTANFSSNQNTICQNGCINFQDLSQDAVSWSWYFPGAVTETSMDQNPIGICYDSPGVYPVFLIVYSSDGISNVMMREDYLTVNATPALPVISLNGISLTSTNASSYQWYFNNQPIHAANTQTCNALQNGNYTVMITDANGCSSVSLPVYIGITGVNNPDDESAAKIYPNPSIGVFYLLFNQNKKPKTEIEVFDLTGKKLIHTFVTTSSDRLEKIDLVPFPNGVYFLKISDESKVSIRKLIIEK